MKNPADLSAIEARRSIGARELLPSDLVDACIARIEARNPAVNAVITTDFEVARATAAAADAALNTSTALPALHGLPVLIKDLSRTKGLRTTFGSRCFADHVPDHDDIVVERLRSAGAIVLGKTNTPEFGAGANTSNLVFGATGNPYDPSVTSGGSSGGSAAALASHMVPLASGSDLGGSLRIPASYCGVVGMRPSPGVVASRSHVSGFSPLWTDGPMARSVKDLALMLSAISGFDVRDPLCAPGLDFSFNELHQIEDLALARVGFSTDLGVADVETDIAALFAGRRSAIGQHFRSAQALDIDLSDAADIFRVLRAESLYAAYGALAEARPDEIGQNVRVNILEATSLSLADTAQADAGHTKLYRDFQQLFQHIDYLICPATAVSPFPVADNHPVAINGKPLTEYYAWYAITWALSLTGCPVITLPCGFDAKGMPFGIQIVGPRHSDAKLLRIAHSLELALAADGLGRVSPKFDAEASDTPE
ncbi:amidase [uncultured Ruegeria sp.]|uniref:amidase n=1 Tax=uncultured Ruegeria sp. TaxID=259304 RepID=UPI002616CD4F|nr:amidase [uncultured Ruegeria sp.]